MPGCRRQLLGRALSPAFDTGRAGRRDRANRSCPIIHASRDRRDLGSMPPAALLANVTAPGACLQTRCGCTLAVLAAGCLTDNRRRSHCQVVETCGGGSTHSAPPGARRDAAGLPIRSLSMRLPILFIVLIAANTAPAAAQSPTSYPWCARPAKMDSSSSMSCYFTSYQQCMTTLSGLGGFCVESPYYHGPSAKARPRTSRRGAR
jgi:hypothetical protein